MTVTETTSEASVETMKAMPSGTNSRPSSPGSANSGMNTSTMITVAYRMAERTSIVARPTISIGCRRLSGCFARSSFRRRSTFSTPTTASSTSPPMAIARPPSVMVLIDSPK
ncbi:hypothetical protein X551_04593 [Methylibium sp. T29]|nr:hypothetical protein X551_04593 [Methylibium sp. T29]EWS57386.1 hypothetical protein Y694_04608 [Methylibium sp. T29-B]